MHNTIQQALTKFFETIFRVVSEGSSESYAAMVMNQFNIKLQDKFPFVNHIKLEKNRITIGAELNSVDKEVISKYLTIMMQALFSDLFAHLIRKKMDESLYDDLKEIGVDIK